MTNRSSGDLRTPRDRAAFRGRILHNRFLLLQPLDSGGMGQVWLAHDLHLDRKVAVKFAHPDLYEQPDDVERFLRETRALVKLAMPGLIPILDRGEVEETDEAGTMVLRGWLAMPFMAGGTLQSRLPAANGASGEPMPPDLLEAWLFAVARVLDEFHRRCFVHRDVKPSNILFDAAGDAYLADAGIALDRSDTKDRLTAPGHPMGTARYMSPEAWTGNAEPATDQYALAVTVHETLTGEVPKQGRVAPQLRGGLRKALQRALHPDPRRRFPTCTAFARAVLGESPTVTAWRVLRWLVSVGVGGLMVLPL